MNRESPAVPDGASSPDGVTVDPEPDESMVDVVDVVDVADRESFPASDPPSWWAGGPTGPRAADTRRRRAR